MRKIVTIAEATIRNDSGFELLLKFKFIGKEKNDTETHEDEIAARLLMHFKDFLRKYAVWRIRDVYPGS